MVEIDYTKRQPINELYHCIQSEGSKAGTPNILVRTTGCALRCYFGEGGFCDTPYSSYSPEKGKFTLGDVKNFIEDKPNVKSMMITGGGPTMHPVLVNQLLLLAKKYNMFVTMETEGSEFIQTDIAIDLLSLSPKFSNSVPYVGLVGPNNKIVTQSMVNSHEKGRLNYQAMRNLIDSATDYHLKPVVSKDQVGVWDEILHIQTVLDIPHNKVWVMPAGDTIEKVIPNYTYVMDECIRRGYNFTGRPHIIAYSDKRGV